MFTKFKLAIEKWLRGIIADEVSKLDHDLSNERAALYSTIAQGNAAVDRLNELSYFKENAELRADIKDLTERTNALINSVKQLHPELQQ